MKMTGEVKTISASAPGPCSVPIETDRGTTLRSCQRSVEAVGKAAFQKRRIEKNGEKSMSTPRLTRFPITLILRCVSPGIVLAVLTVLIAWTCVGCTMPVDRVDGVLDNVAQPDVPRPNRFKMNEESWSYAYADGARSSMTEFVGKRSLTNLVPWYIDAMEKNGWSHRTLDVGRTRVLTFTKAREVAQVSIFRKYNTRHKDFETIVRVEIGPQKTEEMPVYRVIPLPNSEKQSGTDRIPTDNRLGDAPPATPVEKESSSLPSANRTTASRSVNQLTTEQSTDSWRTEEPSLREATYTTSQAAGTESFDAEVLPASSTQSTMNASASIETATVKTAPIETATVKAERIVTLDDAIHGPPLPDVLDEIPTDSNTTE